MFCPNCGSQIPDGGSCPKCNPQQQGLCGAVPPPPPPPPPSSLPNGGFKVNNVTNNPNLKLLASAGCFSVYEHQKDMSTEAATATIAYFMHEMNVRKRQVLAQLNGNTIKMQAGMAKKVVIDFNSADKVAK